MRKHEKGLFRGRKISNTHSTTISLARVVIRALKPLEDVEKITIGPISRIAVGPPRIKMRTDPKSGQAHIQCRDSNSVQILWCRGEMRAIESALWDIPNVKFVRT